MTMTVDHTMTLDAAGAWWEVTLTAGPAPDWGDEMSTELHTQLGTPEWVRAALEQVDGGPAAAARAVWDAWPVSLPPLSQVTVTAGGDTATHPAS